MLGYFVWNWPREAFTLPYFNLPIYWYSLWFAAGFYGAVLIARSLVVGRAIVLVGKEQVNIPSIDRYIERLALYVFVGMIVGARLGHVLFYDVEHYLHPPIDILNLRQGGLSSHGAVIGMCLALWRCGTREFTLSYLPTGTDMLDLVAIGSAWAAGCIRIGNCFNQEIVGTISSLPWAVIFVSPLDASGGVPRHPVELYEAIVSFALLIPLYLIGRKGGFATHGRLTGWYLIITFTARSMLEHFKVPQCTFDIGPLHMGQLLSIPVILFGIFLIVRASLLKRAS